MCFNTKLLDLKYKYMKTRLKMLPNSENDDKIARKLNKNLNMRSLIYVLKAVIIIKQKRRLKRYTSLDRHIPFLRKNSLNKTHINGRKILENRLLAIGCELIQVSGDGNCLFRSISCNLFEKQKYHMYVRKRCVEYMLNFKDEYSIYFEDNAFYEYIKNMSKNGYWGDELCIKATADAFNCIVYIITSTSENWCLKYESKYKNNLKKYVFLAYSSPTHYDYFRLIKK
ncbi:OTU-like cysteine protease, putative [Plasmodium gallinaceum]|uniref:OTU-like cysteine protease, putative n=1 Tax=Plasmodium gallinaceum TaxID=5849 RepID=A0A1J1GZQ0_PLAGA|nr:OTU-like cysteine protease, putative [Plasmodium gallinaceum]CRG96778.1 OTU-like cysteine protease, putative [Plasmodium gallinaceum]